MSASAGGELERVASTILGEVPEHEGNGPDSLQFRTIEPGAASRRVAAVDGGSTVVLDVKTTGLYFVRTGYVIRDANDRYLDRLVAKTPSTVTRRTLASEWARICRNHAWGVDVPLPILERDRLVPQLAEAERILAEYDAARRALKELRRGDLLLMDGSLDEEERYAPLRESLLDRAQEAGVDLVAVSKDSSLSLNGILPLTIELEEIAHSRQIATPWWIDVTEALGGRERLFRTLCVRLDARAPAYRVDVGLGVPAACVASLLQISNDPVFAGYPYPLGRIHQHVNYSTGEAIDLRRQLEGIVARARGYRLSLRLFGRGRDVLALAN
jgi:hypothetical protein